MSSLTDRLRDIRSFELIIFIAMFILIALALTAAPIITGAVGNDPIIRDK